MFVTEGARDVVRHEHAEIGAGLREFTDGGAELDNTPWLVCGNNRVGEVQLRLVALSLRKPRFAAALLRCAFSASICRCAGEGCLRTLHCSLLLTQPEVYRWAS